MKIYKVEISDFIETLGQNHLQMVIKHFTTLEAAQKFVEFVKENQTEFGMVGNYVVNIRTITVEA